MWNDENTIKFYSYFFFEVKKPIVIEARNKEQARGFLEQLFPTLPDEYRESRIIGESVKKPLKFYTQKKIKGVAHVWNGEGWQPLKK